MQEKECIYVCVTLLYSRKWTEHCKPAIMEKNKNLLKNNLRRTKRERTKRTKKGKRREGISYPSSLPNKSCTRETRGFCASCQGKVWEAGVNCTCQEELPPFRAVSLEVRLLHPFLGNILTICIKNPKNIHAIWISLAMYYFIFIWHIVGLQYSTGFKCTT